jgi:hypothetical protein
MTKSLSFVIVAAAVLATAGCAAKSDDQASAFAAHRIYASPGEQVAGPASHSGAYGYWTVPIPALY